ncbi:MAG: cytochrome b, partial [Promicromonosporaceae bacterium]|nr:cytochrome b [Promicromonosporaceae bacterium]
MLADRGLARRGVLAALARRRVYLTWSSLVGVVIATCLVLLTVTGILLAVAYRPSGALTTYDGVYAPLAGARVSQAYDSVVTLSLETAGGMLVRQTHHWAALVLPAAMVVQLLTKFFSGWFRRPRRGSWVLLVALFAVVLAGGWSGYALPDDMLSGTGLQITQGVVLAIPFVGTRLSSLIFGGGFPGHIIEHLYPIHVYVVPALIVALIAVRAVLARRHGQAVPASDAVRGSLGVRLWPDATLLAVGMAAMTSAVLVLLGAVATITPVWAYGPADPGDAGAGSQPDWYTGFLDGALRLVPSGWETVWSGYTVTFAVLVPLAVVGAWFAAVAVYPFVE